MAPQAVLQWPWIVVEEIWASYEKRQKRRMKYEMAMAEITGSAVWGKTPVGQGSPATESVAPSRPPRKKFETPPTDADNWDIPEAELDLLAASGFPVKIVRGTHPS